MNELKIDNQMKVETLKLNFKEMFGGSLRVYKDDKGHLADDNQKLCDLRASDMSVAGTLACRASITVGGFERRMIECFGIKVQVATIDDYVLVLDDITLANIGKIKKQATKADMEILRSNYSKKAKNEEKKSTSATNKTPNNLKDFRVEIYADSYFTEFYPKDDDCDLETWDDWESYREAHDEEHFSISDLIPISTDMGLNAKIKVYDEDDNVVFESDDYEECIYNRTISLYPDEDYEEWGDEEWEEFSEDNEGQDNWEAFWGQVKDRKKLFESLIQKLGDETNQLEEETEYYCSIEKMRDCLKVFHVQDTHFDINKLHFLYVNCEALESICSDCIECDEVTAVAYAAYDGSLVEDVEPVENGWGEGLVVYDVNYSDDFIEVNGEKNLE